MLKLIPSDHIDPVDTHAPGDALSVGLDILEYLAATASPKGVPEIAGQIQVSPPQIMQAIEALENLGYVADGEEPGTYVVTSRLYELGVNAPFIQCLIDRARPILQALSDDIRQSCNLAIPFGRHLTVVLQTQSPGAFSINVPEGFRYDSPASAPAIACFGLTRSPVQAKNVLDGVLDLSCPIYDEGTVTAVVTIPYIRTVESPSVEACTHALQEAAVTLSGGQTASISRLAVLYG